MRSYRRRDKKNLDLTGLENCLLSAVSRAKQLRRATQQLPKVDDKSNSECPFAKELYAEKDKLQQEVQGLWKQLHDYLADVKWLIGACKNDLTVVSAGEDRLHGDRARGHFSEDETRLAARYKHYLSLRDRIERTIQLVEETVEEAFTKQYPGGHLQKGAGRQGPKMPPETDPSARRSVGADKEMDDLFELDRRRQSEALTVEERVMGTHGQ